MLVTAVNQLEDLSKNRQYQDSAQLLQAVVQLMQHFKQYKSVVQIRQLSDRIHRLKSYLEDCVLKEFEQGFSPEGALVGQAWILHDACLVASVLSESTQEKMIKRYVDLQLKSYRQIFSRPTEEVSQLDNISRRYAFLKRILKSCSEVNIFPDHWAVNARISEKFCACTKLDLEAVMKNNVPSVQDFLKALQLTIEFESQLTKRFEKNGAFNFEKAISSGFEPYFYLYINAEDATISSMIDSYAQSDIAIANLEDDNTMVVLPSSTDLFYFYKETLVQCSKFSTGKALLDLSKVFAKYLIDYCNKVILGGIATNEKKSIDYFRLASLSLNTADYCSMTTQQLEDKLKEKIDAEYVDQIDFTNEKERFLQAISLCIDAIIKSIDQVLDTQFLQMTRLPWGTMDSVGDQSDYVTQIMDIIKRYTTIIGKTVSNKRYYRTFCDRFAEWLITKYIAQIFRCKPISEIGAEQLLLDTHSIKTLLMDIPSVGSSGDDVPRTIPSSYSRIVSNGILKVEAILKTTMSPIEPPEAFVENYLLLVKDKHIGNFTRILDLKGIRKSDQGPIIDTFQRRVPYHDNLSDNSHMIPPESAPSVHQSTMIPSSITTSFSNIASTAASSIKNNNNVPLGLSPTESARGKLNENFRKLVMTGMAFRKDLQEKRGES
ncbi:unnamed protein product [Rhizopus microsporus]